MKKILEFKNVYIEHGAVLGGPKEAKGPLGMYLDEAYSDLHMGQKSFEGAEIMLQREIIAKLLYKAKYDDSDIDVVFGGDLINQEVISNYALREYDIPFCGIYGACSTSVLGAIMASIFVELEGEGTRAISMTSSHNCTSERQFRSPTEYGGAKSKTLTSTVTGASGLLISGTKTDVRISKALIGRVVDVGATNMFDMGRAMAPAAAESLIEFFELTKTTPEDYDLILTGDLSLYGSEIIKKILNERYGYSKNYNDCGLIIYDRENQAVFAGGSGCACCGIVMSGYILSRLLDGSLKKVLIAATGALMNTMMTLQKETIPAVSHVILLESAK